MYKVLSDIQLTKNFKLSEFECHDGQHEVLIDPKLIVLIQQLRDALGVSITIAAAYRNEAHNKKVGGAPRSQHLLGKAVDIKVKGVTPKQVAMAGEKVGFKGIGVYTHGGDYFTHLDVRDVASYWHDKEGGDLVSIKSLKSIPGN
jgi:uncharacterized protein YcbK (DUF882 family)